MDRGYKLPTFGGAKNPFVKASTETRAKSSQQSELKIVAAIEPVVIVATDPGKSAIDGIRADADVALVAQTISERAVEKVSKPFMVLPKVEVKPTEVGLSGVERWVAALEETAPAVRHPVLRFLDWLEVSAMWCKTRVAHINWRKPSMPKFKLPQLALPKFSALSKLPKFSRANPFKWMPKRDQRSVPVVAQATGPVQAELSLEKVRVLRNDLSDADLEIAAVQMAQPKQPKPVRAVKVKVEPVPVPKVEETVEMEAVEA
jgi:hypothetical protein